MAKLRLNAKVICQACEESTPARLSGTKPGCRAVLVPQGAAGVDFVELCRLLGLTVILMQAGRKAAFVPSLPGPKQDAPSKVWFELARSQCILLPSYVPDVESGLSRPVRLTA